MEGISNNIRSQFVLNPISRPEEQNFFLDEEFELRYPQCAEMNYAARVLYAISYEVNKHITFYKRHKKPKEPSNNDISNTHKAEKLNTNISNTKSTYPIFRAHRIINLVNKSHYYVQNLKTKNLYDQYSTAMRTKLEQAKLSHAEYIQFLYETQNAIYIDISQNGVLILDEKSFVLNSDIISSTELKLLMIGLFIVLPDSNKPNKLKIIFDAESLEPNLLKDYIKNIDTNIEFEFHTLQQVNKFNKLFSTKSSINKTYCSRIYSAFTKIQKYLEDKPLALQYHVDTNSEITNSVKFPSKLILEEIKLTEEALFVIELYLEKSKLNLIQNHELEALKTVTKAMACLLVVSPAQIKTLFSKNSEYKEIFYEVKVVQGKIHIEYGYKNHFKELLITLPSTLMSIHLALNKLHIAPNSELPELIKQDIANFSAVLKNIILKTQERNIIYFPTLAIAVYVEILLLQNKHNKVDKLLKNDVPMLSSIVSLIFCGIVLEKVLHNDIYGQHLAAARRIVIATAPAIFMNLHSSGEKVYEERFKFLHALCIECHKFLYHDDNILAISENQAIDIILSIADQLFKQIWPEPKIQSHQFLTDYKVSVNGEPHNGYNEYISGIKEQAISLAETTQS
jgi:hypothetical protein